MSSRGKGIDNTDDTSTSGEDDEVGDVDTTIVTGGGAMGTNDTVMAASPSREARSLDDYMEDAYRQCSSWCFLCDQWKYWVIMLALGIANSSDASEILCLSYILSDEKFENLMLLDSNWRGGMLAAAVFAGMLVGGLVVGTLGDWKGRRPMLIFGLLLNTSAGILSACSPNVFVLTFLRMIAGVGIGATVPPLFTLVAELAPPSRRGFFVTFCASFWMVGSIFVALVAIVFLKDQDYHTTDPNSSGNNHRYLFGFWTQLPPWRLFALTCAIPSALGAGLVIFYVPESPRFLALQRHFDRALTSANTLGTSLQYNGPPLQRWEMEEQFGQICFSSGSYHPSAVVENNETTGSLSCLQFTQLAMEDFFVSAGKLYLPDLRHTTWPLQLLWFSLSFSSYGLMTWINTLFFAVHLEDVYFNALLFALSNLPGNIFTAIFMDRTGRAQSLVGSILGAALSLLFFAFFANTNGEQPPNAYGVVVSACTFQCFTIIAWNTISAMSSELFPTTVRSTGMGVCAASGRVGAMVAQFVNGFLVGSPVRLLVVASITLSVGALTPFLLPQRGDMTGQPVHDDISKAIRTKPSHQDAERSNDTNFRFDGASSNVGLSRRPASMGASYQKVATTDTGTNV